MVLDRTNRRLDATPAEVLEELTHTHGLMLEKHGPLIGLKNVEPPTGAKTFERQQAQLAAQQDAEANPARRISLMQERQAREHQQIGRLASFVAGYELAHGDIDKASAIMELGGSHFELAENIRANMVTLAPGPANQNADDRRADMERLIPADRGALRPEGLTSPENGRGGQSY